MSCPNCFSGGITTQHPKGTEQKIHGRDTYVAQPDEGTTPRGVIVFITDAFGWKIANNRVLCDHYAKRGGYLVYMPDFMDGNAVPEYGLTVMDKVLGKSETWVDLLVWKPYYLLFHLVPTMITFQMKCAPPKRKQLVFDFVTALRTSPVPYDNNNDAKKPLKVGVAGFCWGAKFCVWFAQDDPASRVVRHQSQNPEHSDGSSSSGKQPLIDCAFIAHPSFLEVPGDIEAVRLPLSVAVGDNDMAIKLSQVQQAKQILESKPDAANMYEVNIMPGAAHGFAVRSHPDDEYEMRCAMEAEDQALAWFDKWLARG